jgi:Squalene-hopene cyclase N-terminal domain
MEMNSPTAAAASKPELYFGTLAGGVTRVKDAVRATCEYLLSQQHEDGYWCGELEADTTLESDYIQLHTLLSAGAKSSVIRMRMVVGLSFMADPQTSAPRSRPISR